MKNTDARIYAYKADPWSRVVNISQCLERGGKFLYTGRPPLEEMPEGGQLNPCLTISMDQSQSLMDQLWDIGLRPSEGSGSAGSLRATEKHLGDMRAIVSKKLGVEL